MALTIRQVNAAGATTVVIVSSTSSIIVDGLLAQLEMMQLLRDVVVDFEVFARRPSTITWVLEDLRVELLYEVLHLTNVVCKLIVVIVITVVTIGVTIASVGRD